MTHIVDYQPQAQLKEGRAARQWLEQSLQDPSLPNDLAEESQDELPIAVSPPPIAWPRVFPSL